MTTLREAAQEMLHALEHAEIDPHSSDAVYKAMDALKAALVEDAMQKFSEVNQELEAALAEPVAWIYEFYADMGHKRLAFEEQPSAYNTPLYATPNLVYIQNNIMKTALEQIAGVRAIIDNMLSDKDIAQLTLERIRLQDEQRKN